MTFLCGESDQGGTRTCLLDNGHTGAHKDGAGCWDRLECLDGSGEACSLERECEIPSCHARVRRMMQTFTGLPPVEINHPQHYGGDTTYEAIKVIEAWELGFHLGNAVKYICRAGSKEGADPLDDLKKAKWYLERHIRNQEELDRG